MIGADHAMKHIPELDGLRAFAVGAVILNHAMPMYFPGGFIGVDVFFVLSGYLITRVLADEHERHGHQSWQFLHAPRAASDAGLVGAACCLCGLGRCWLALSSSAITCWRRRRRFSI